DGQTIFDGFAAENSAAQNSSPFTLTGLGDPVQIFGGRVTSNYFDVLGVRLILGRNFLPEEEESADVALVTKNFWQERLEGDPNGAWRFAHERRALVRFRKFVRQCNRGRCRRFRRVAFGAAGSANSLQFSAVGSE